MKRKILFAILFMLLPAVASASARTVPYVALDIGAYYGHWSFIDNMSNRSRFSTRLPLVNGSIGVGEVLGTHFWVAAEFNAYYSNIFSHYQTISVNGTNAGARLREKYGYGISFIPGIILTSNGCERGLIYARLGAVQTRFEYQQTVAPAGDTRMSDTSWRRAGLVGGGVQFRFYEHMSARAEYDRVYYYRFFALGNRIAPIDNIIKAGLVYSFV